MVAAAAALLYGATTRFKVVGGALDPHKLARSSYEAELQVLIDLLKRWPDDAISLSTVGRTVIAFGLLCHLHTCCLGSMCAVVLQFGLVASLN